MKKLVRSLFVSAAIALPLTMVAASPAAAAPNADVAVITGSGSILPGLTATPAPQAISFNGNALTVGTHPNPGPANYACSFTGNDINGSAAEGVGTVTGTCGPLSFPSCNFVRVAIAVVVVCPQTSPIQVGAAVCAFRPIDVNPTRNYELVCVAGYASQN